MAATTAEGEGNRFIAIAVETSEALPVSDPGQACQRVAYAGPGAKGIIEVTESPAIEGVHVLGTHRFVADDGRTESPRAASSTTTSRPSARPW